MPLVLWWYNLTVPQGWLQGHASCPGLSFTTIKEQRPVLGASIPEYTRTGPKTVGNLTKQQQAAAAGCPKLIQGRNW